MAFVLGAASAYAQDSRTESRTYPVAAFALEYADAEPAPCDGPRCGKAYDSRSDDRRVYPGRAVHMLKNGTIPSLRVRVAAGYGVL